MFLQHAPLFQTKELYLGLKNIMVLNQLLTYHNRTNWNIYYSNFSHYKFLNKKILTFNFTSNYSNTIRMQQQNHERHHIVDCNQENDVP